MLRNIKRVTLVLLPSLIIGLCLGRYLNLAYDDASRKPLVQLKDLKILKEIISGTSNTSAGRSDTPLGRSDTSFGRSDTSFGRSDISPGRSDTSSERSDTPLGRSDTSLGRSDISPGRSDTSIGRSDPTLGRSDISPGRSGTSLGRSDISPGRSGTSLGRSDTSLGRSDISQARPDTSPGKSDTVQGRSNTSPKIIHKLKAPSKVSLPSVHTTKPPHKAAFTHVKTGTERIAEIDNKTEVQKKVIKEFCARHPQLKNGSPYKWPSKHLFYNDEFKLIYCYVPKVGCTTTKLMMEIMNGEFPANISVQSLVKEDVHKYSHYASSLLLHLPVAERQKRIKTYYKFVVLRDPIVRILSAYIDKLALPMNKEKILNSNTKISITKDMAIQLGIMKGTTGQAPSKWWWLQKKPFQSITFRNQTVYYVPFEVYLEYFRKRDYIQDEHFAPASHLCNPCQLDFDYYGNFETLTEDIHTVLDRIGAPRWLLPKLKEHSTLSTEDLMDLYFGDMPEEDRLTLRRSLEDKTGYNFEGAPTESVSRDLLRGVFERVGGDADLYYSLFPGSKRADKMYTS